MSDQASSPLTYQSSSYRLASFAAGAFLAAIGIALAAFSQVTDTPLGGRFLAVDLGFTVVAAGWMFLGARVGMTIGDGEVRVTTKTRTGRFPVSKVDEVEFLAPTVLGVSLGSPYVHLERAGSVTNTWVPAPPPTERAAVKREMNARIKAERAALRPLEAPTT